MALVYVQGSIRLEANAAASFARVDAKFGGGLTITAPYGGHRSEADQKYLRDGYEKRMAGVKGYSNFNYAAKPRQSNHEGKAPDWEGFAVDISNYRKFPGLHAAMAAEGWVRDPVELWHYNFMGKRTQVVGVAGNVISIGSEDELDVDIAIDGTTQPAAVVIRDLYYNVRDLAEFVNAIKEIQVLDGGKLSLEATVVDIFESARTASANGTKLLARPAASGVSAVAIDYDLLANKVADKLAARLVS